MHDWHSMKSQKAFIKSCVISFMQIVDVVYMQIYANIIYANIISKEMQLSRVEKMYRQTHYSMK